MKKEDQELLYKALCGYLPHDLKINTSYGVEVPKGGHVYNLCGLSYEYDKMCSEKSIFVSVEEKPNKELSNYYYQFKPHLRPLSDLTKKITHNGKTFVPIVELLQFKHQRHFNENKNSRYGVVQTEQTPNRVTACFKYAANFSISLNLAHLNFEPYFIIEKLKEWHFNLDLPKEMYIDINTLEAINK